MLILQHEDEEIAGDALYKSQAAPKMKYLFHVNVNNFETLITTWSDMIEVGSLQLAC